MISGLNYSMKKRQFSIKWLLGIVTLVAVCAAAIGMIYNSLGPRALAEERSTFWVSFLLPCSCSDERCGIRLDHFFDNGAR